MPQVGAAVSEKAEDVGFSLTPTTACLKPGAMAVWPKYRKCASPCVDGSRCVDDGAWATRSIKKGLRKREKD